MAERLIILHGKNISSQDKNFAEMARKYSEGPGADEGGDLGEFTMAQLEPELRKILEQMSEGGFSDLIIRPNGIQIIHLIKKQEGKVKTLAEAARQGGLKF